MASKPKKTAASPKSAETKKAGASAEILLDPVFYPLRLVRRAAQDFDGLAQIEARPSGDRLRVRFCGMNRALARKLPDEFVNYLLSLAVQEK